MALMLAGLFWSEGWTADQVSAADLYIDQYGRVVKDPTPKPRTNVSIAGIFVLGGVILLMSD